MNILLCLPKTLAYDTNHTQFPLGVAYISSCLKQAGHTVFCLNFFLPEHDNVYESLRTIILEKDISIIGTGDLVTNFSSIQEIIHTAKRIKPDITTIIGGGFVTYSPFEAMQIIPAADYGVIGEGEITVCELVDAIENGRNVDAINGIIYRKKDGHGNEIPHMTAKRKELVDLDTLPWPDYEGLRLFDINPSHLRAATVSTSRSCPFSCTYCVQRSFRSKYRQRSLDSIFAEIDHVATVYDAKYIVISDELFALDRERVLEFCRRIKTYGVRWDVSMRISPLIDASLLSAMWDGGCRRIFYGLESADDRVLRSMKKKITVAEMENVLRITHEAGMPAYGNFIFGDIEESADTLKTTTEWITKNKHLLSFCSACLIIIFPGSRLWEVAVERGLIQDTAAYIQAGCPYINISKLSDAEYEQLLTVHTPFVNSLMQGDGEAVQSYTDFSVDRSNMRYSVRTVCPGCGSTTTIGIPHERVQYLFSENCASCGKLLSVNIYKDVVAAIDACLSGVLDRFDCVFWGIGGSWSKLRNLSTVLDSDTAKYALLDLRKGGRGLTSFGRTIYSPEYLHSHTPHLVIATFEIIQEIQSIVKIDPEKSLLVTANMLPLLDNLEARLLATKQP